jgi:F-type H+/Na+-transporting ATPase subunit alpha
MNASAPAVVEQFKKKLHEELAKVVVEEVVGTASTAKVIRFADGVAEIAGLPDPRIGQVIHFPDATQRAREEEERKKEKEKKKEEKEEKKEKEANQSEEPPIYGIIEDVNEATVKCLVLGEERFVSQGDHVVKSSDQLRVPVSPRLLGHVWDPLCWPLDTHASAPDWKDAMHLPIERRAPGVTDRQKINSQLNTGIKAVDTMLPIGHGQRMLLIGDRGTGKTSIALDAIVRQNEINKRINNETEGKPPREFKDHDPATVYCVYVGIGKKASEISQICRKLEKNGALRYTVIITTMANDPAPLNYICPFSGCTIAEYFRDIGRNALIVYDDLSKHATAYRQLSLILKRPPGREAYPGDIFFLHSRLLERAARIRRADEALPWSNEFREIVREYEGHDWEHAAVTKGGGSLTALPLVETKLDDYATYIATNIISITDGQIFLSKKLVNEGVLPAINAGISVSRVSSAWDGRLKDLAALLRVDMAIYRSDEEIAAMDTSDQNDSKARLDTGRQRVAYFRQEERPSTKVSDDSMIFSIERLYVDLVMLNAKAIEGIAKERITDLEAHVWQALRSRDDLLGKKEHRQLLEEEVEKQIGKFKA